MFVLWGFEVFCVSVFYFDMVNIIKVQFPVPIVYCFQCTFSCPWVCLSPFPNQFLKLSHLNVLTPVIYNKQKQYVTEITLKLRVL